MSKFKRKKGSQAGFTLIEMLVVIAIIAGLATLVIPMIGGVREKAAVAEDASNQANLSKQFLTFAELNGGDYPDVGDSLLDAGTVGGVIGDVKLYGEVAGDERSLYVTLLGMGSTGNMLEPFNLRYESGVTTMDGLKAWHGLAKLDIRNVIDHKQVKTVMGVSTPLFPNDSTDASTSRELRYQDDATPPAPVDCYIAILNRTDAGPNGVLDNKYVQAIYEHYNLNVDDDPAAVGNETDRVAAFGIGKENSAVGALNGGMQDAPTTTRFDLNDYYGRYVALYLLPDAMGGKAKFLGVLDPRGQLISAQQKTFAAVE